MVPPVGERCLFVSAHSRVPSGTATSEMKIPRRGKIRRNDPAQLRPGAHVFCSTTRRVSEKAAGNPKTHRRAYGSLFAVPSLVWDPGFLF